MKTHSTDLVSLIFGLLFLAVPGWWLVNRYVDIELPNFGWIMAVALIAVGLLGIAASLRRDRDRDDRQPVSTSAAPADPPD